MQISQWDLLLIGDGSGTGWNDGNGYASILIDRQTRGRKTSWGGNRWGSVNMAEMEAYLKPLIWFHSQFSERLRQQAPLYVHIITDSQVTALHGSRTANPAEPLPKVAQRPLWAAMRELGHMGYQLTYHWAKRCNNDLNVMADLIAGLSRREILGIDTPSPDMTERARSAIARIVFADPAGEPLSAYNVNPDGGMHATNDAADYQ